MNTRPAIAADFLGDGGNIGEIMRAIDWTRHPLGAPHLWPQALRTAIRLMLGTRHPLFIFWGLEHYCFYNDAYAESLGPEKHPAMIGAPAKTMWREIWHIIGPQIEYVLSGAGATWHEDELAPIIRHGRLDDVYWTYSYSPIDHDGRVGGVLVLVRETTKRVLSEQRQRSEFHCLRDMVKQAPSFMAMMSGPDHRFEFVNEAYERLFGARDIIGKTLREALPDLEGEVFGDVADDVFRTGEIYMGRDQRVVLQSAGSERRREVFIDFIYQPIRDASGAVNAIFVDGYDVTDRVRSERALRDSERRLRFLDRLTEETRGVADLESILAITTRDVRSHFSVAACTYADREADQDQFAVRGDWSAAADQSLAALEKFVAANSRLAGPLVFGDAAVELAPEQAAPFVRLGARATICLPYFKNGRLTALMAIHCAGPRRWTGPEVSLLQEVLDRTRARLDAARAKARLRLSEQRFRAAIDAVQGTIWTNDARGRMIGEQPGWSALTGQTFDEYQNYGWARAVHPDDAGPTIEAWNEAVEQRKTFEFTHRLKRAGDEQWRNFSIRAIPLLNMRGDIEEWVGVHTDITEQRHARDVLLNARERLEAAVAERTAALRLSEARLRAIFATSHLFQGLLDPDGALIDANAASLAAIALDREQVIGQKYWNTPWFTGTPGMSAMIEEIVHRVAQTGESETRSFTVHLPTGTRSFDFALRPVMDRAQKVVALVPEAIETTARLRAEEELRQAQKLEAVGQLTGGVAHDFNNLLMVISGGLNLMERRNDPERQRILVERMREAVARGANLTQQLLAFSRRHELKPEVVDVAEHIGDMRDLLTRSLGGDIRVDFDLSGDLTPIFVDQTALQLAILNLAVNARDAMPSGGVITIKAQRGGPGDACAPCVAIAVIDNGVGMSPEVRARIFEPFFTTKDIGRGSGLGLAQVHGFVQQSGGRIEVESSPGAGTTMTLVLPAARESTASATKKALEFRAERSRVDMGHALLVEDDDQVAAATGEMFEHLGWRITRVASAQAALDAFADVAKIDLVFSDVMMPGGKSGIDLAAELRRRRPNLPIVLASGYAAPVRRQATELGVPLLPKPFNLDTLAAIIEVARLA